MRRCVRVAADHQDLQFLIVGDRRDGITMVLGAAKRKADAQRMANRFRQLLAGYWRIAVEPIGKSSRTGQAIR